MRILLLCILGAVLQTVQGDYSQVIRNRVTAKVIKKRDKPMCSSTPRSTYYLQQFQFSFTKSGGGSCFEKKGYFPSDFVHCNNIGNEALGGSTEDQCLKNCSDYSEAASGHWRQLLEPIQTISFVKKVIGTSNDTAFNEFYIAYRNLKNLHADKQKDASEQKFIHDRVFYRQVCVKISEPNEKMENSHDPFTFIDTDGTHDYRLDHQVPYTGTTSSYNSYWDGYRSGVGMCLGGGKATRWKFAYSSTRFLLEDMIVRNRLGDPQASAETLAAESYDSASASDILTSTKLLGNDCAETCAQLGSHPEKYNHQGKYYYTGRFRPTRTNSGKYIPASYLSYYRSKDNNEESYAKRDCCCMIRKTKCPSGKYLMLAKTDTDNNYCVSACPADFFNNNGVCRTKAFESRDAQKSAGSCSSYAPTSSDVWRRVIRAEYDAASSTSDCAWVGGDRSPSTYKNGFGQNMWFYKQTYVIEQGGLFNPTNTKKCCFQKRRTRCPYGSGIGVFSDALHCYNSTDCNLHSNVDNTCRPCGTHEESVSINVKIGEECTQYSGCNDVTDTIDICRPNSVQFCQHGYGYDPSNGGSCTKCLDHQHTDHGAANGRFVPFEASGCIADSHAVCPDGYYLDHGGPERDSTCTCNAPGYQLGTLQKIGMDMNYETEGRCNTTGDFYIPPIDTTSIQFFNQTTLDNCYALCQNQDTRFYPNIVSAVWAAPIDGKAQFHTTDFFISSACQCSVAKDSCSQWIVSYDTPRTFAVPTPNANDSPEWDNWNSLAWGWYVQSEFTYETFVWDYSCDPCPAGKNSNEDLTTCIDCPKSSSYNQQGEECMTWAVQQLGGTVVASGLLENFQGKDTLKNQIVAISGNTRAKQKSMVKLFADKMKHSNKADRAIVMAKETISLTNLFKTRIGTGTEVKLVVSGTKTIDENDANVCDEADFDVATDGLIFDISLTTVGDVALLCRGSTPLVKMEFIEDGDDADKAYDTYQYKCHSSGTWDDNWVSIQTTETEFSCNNKKYLVNSLGGVNCNYTSTLNEDGSPHAIDGTNVCGSVLESGEVCRPTCMVNYYLKSPATCEADGNGAIAFTPAVCAPEVSEITCRDIEWMYFSGGGATPCCEGMENTVECMGHLEETEMELVNSLALLQQEDGSDCSDGMEIIIKNNKIICK